ncbi:YHS domain-containing protein [Acidobacteriota bacterium]
MTKTNNMKVLALLAVAVFLLSSSGIAAEKVICPVMKNEVKDISKAPRYEYKGKTYYFCCAGCVDKFKADPEKYLASEEGELHEHGEHAENTEHQAHGEETNGKNTICPVMGNPIKDYEKAPKVEYNGKTYYFCCAGCDAKFKEDPEKYIAFLNETVKCAVSGEEIKKGQAAGVAKKDGKTYYFCCANCEAKFKEDPEKYIKGNVPANDGTCACSTEKKK